MFAVSNASSSFATVPVAESSVRLTLVLLKIDIRSPSSSEADDEHDEDDEDDDADDAADVKNETNFLLNGAFDVEVCRGSDFQGEGNTISLLGVSVTPVVAVAAAAAALLVGSSFLNTATFSCN